MTIDIHAERILILDFGSQYTQLIARRVRELGVYCEIHPWDMPAEAIHAWQAKGVILSGGPESVTADDSPRINDVLFELGCPLLGICYGMQAMAHQLGGSVHFSEAHEYGHAKLNLTAENPLWQDFSLSEALDVWMSHGDRVEKLPAGFQVIATSENAPIAAIADLERQYYGVQFHPEVTHTTQGKTILQHFLFSVCGCEATWTPSHFIEENIVKIREQVGDEQVILGLSGGVDSSVAAALIHRAIGQQLTCVFIDNGLLRANEVQQVETMFGQHLGLHLITVDASDAFLSALAGVDDPEQKRKVIGRVFIETFESEAKKLTNAKWLAQGTIYPDVIESAKTKHGKAHVIKSHHNVGGLPEHLNLKLLEPLRELFKDEVRKLGTELGLPHDVVYRHPFPGPGLATRVLGAIEPNYLTILRQADAIFMEELHREDWYNRVSQAFAVFLPIRSVGVTGDARNYAYVIALRSVETTDFMTAHWTDFPAAFLQKVSNRICNEVADVARVVYDVSGKPPATIEWE